MPDATGLELISQELSDANPGAILGTEFARERAVLLVAPALVPNIIKALMDKGYTFIPSVHGVDYWPEEEPRLGVVYEMMDMRAVDRITLKARVSTEDPHIPSIIDLFPGANYDEREVLDMFGIVFDGHPDLRRILMPEDYEGFPQRRDFPVGGEPVLFTHNEGGYGEWQ